MQDSTDLLDKLLRETQTPEPAWNGMIDRKISQHDIPVLVIENELSNDTDLFIDKLGNSLGLTIPAPRSRSNSIHSIASSLYSANNDDYSDLGSDYGAKSPFPGATIVQIPSPWIRTISSPSQTSLHDFSSQHGSPNPAMLDNQLKEPSHYEIQQLDFLDFYNQQCNEPQSPFQGLGGTSVSSPKVLQIPNSNSQQTSFEVPTHLPSAFTRPYNLKSHYRGHIGERPYKCTDPDCSSSFTRKHDLKRHMKLHSGDRGFMCPVCGKQFSRNDAVNRHLKPSENGKESACALKMEVDELKMRLG